MRNQRVLSFAIFFFCIGSLFAQSPPPSNLSGSNLRSWLKTNWYNGYHNQLGYTTARRRMYNYIDNQNNKITDVYSGYIKNWNYGGSGTNPQPINAEHTVPQSFFGSSEPMRSDLHQLFPCHGSVNSSRGNLPFAEIDDNQTTRWWRNGSSQTSKPSSSIIDQYAEYTSGYFEPREEQKGNTARAVFYFFTMYPTQAGSISGLGDINTLYQWHLDDPVDSDEMNRNNSIENYQGNRNPYVDYPDLVAVAWGFSTGGGGGGSASQLFISEYIEGSSYNKAIEVVNLTGSSVNLSSYQLKKQTNGAGSWSGGFTLSGTLSDGQVHVVCHSSAWSSLKNLVDQTTTNSFVSFNGNDPIGLFYNGTLIDIVGNFNGGTSNFAANVTKRRKTSVTGPSTSYNTSEWDNFSSNTFSDVGQYGTAKTFAVAPVNNLAKEVRIYPNPFQEQFRVELPMEMEGVSQVELVDMTGRIIRSSELYAGESVDMGGAELAGGMYLLRVHHEGAVHNYRLVKQ